MRVLVGIGIAATVVVIGTLVLLLMCDKEVIEV